MRTKPQLVNRPSHDHSVSPQTKTQITVYCVYITCVYITVCVYSRAPRPPPPPLQMVWEACGGVHVESPSLLPCLWCGVWYPPPSFSLRGVGSCGWGSPSLPPGVGFGGVEFVPGSLGGVESVVLPEWVSWCGGILVSADLGDSC